MSGLIPRDILLAPREDFPRLSFANELSQRGTPKAVAWSKLIKAQCAMAANPLTKYSWYTDPNVTYSLGEYQNWIRSSLDYCLEKHDGFNSILLGFVRGMIEEIRCSDVALKNHWKTLLARPELKLIRRLAIYSVSDEPLSHLASIPFLSRITHLDLRESTVENDTMESFLQSEYLGPLQSLKLGLGEFAEIDRDEALAAGDLLTSETARALSKSPKLNQLESLSVATAQLGDEGLDILLASPLAASLNSLEIINDRVSHRGINRFAESGHEFKLEHLNLDQNLLRLEGARLLGNSNYLRRLRHLSLRANSLGDSGTLALSQSKIFSKVIELDISENGIGEAGLESLFRSSNFKSLMSLIAKWNHLNPFVFRRIKNSPLLSTIRNLDLHGNKIGDEGLRLLFTKNNLDQLTHLSLGDNGISDDGAAFLAELPSRNCLRFLNLSPNPITSYGAQRLLDSLYLKNCRILLAPHHIDPPLRKRLDDRFKRDL